MQEGQSSVINPKPVGACCHPSQYLHQSPSGWSTTGCNRFYSQLSQMGGLFQPKRRWICRRRSGTSPNFSIAWWQPRRPWRPQQRGWCWCWEWWHWCGRSYQSIRVLFQRSFPSWSCQKGVQEGLCQPSMRAFHTQHPLAQRSASQLVPSPTPTTSKNKRMMNA